MTKCWICGKSIKANDVFADMCNKCTQLKQQPKENENGGLPEDVGSSKSVIPDRLE